VSVTRVDGKGRVVISKSIRERLGLRKGSKLRVKVEGGRIILEPLGSVAETYYGLFRPKRWPEDLDDYLTGVIGEWGREDM